MISVCPAKPGHQWYDLATVPEKISKGQCGTRILAWSFFQCFQHLENANLALTACWVWW